MASSLSIDEVNLQLERDELELAAASSLSIDEVNLQRLRPAEAERGPSSLSIDEVNLQHQLARENVYMAFQKGTQTAPQGEIMPPQAGI